MRDAAAADFLVVCQRKVKRLCEPAAAQLRDQSKCAGEKAFHVACPTTMQALAVSTQCEGI
jgi:hypothetical protein